MNSRPQILFCCTSDQGYRLITRLLQALVCSHAEIKSQTEAAAAKGSKKKTLRSHIASQRQLMLDLIGTDNLSGLTSCLLLTKVEKTVRENPLLQ